MRGEGTSFNGVLSGSTFDHGRAEFYRQQEEARRLRDRIVRAEFWLSYKLADKQFASEDEMRAAVVGLAVTLGHRMDDETVGVLREAVGALWASGRYRVAVAA